MPRMVVIEVPLEKTACAKCCFDSESGDNCPSHEAPPRGTPHLKCIAEEIRLGLRFRQHIIWKD